MSARGGLIAAGADFVGSRERQEDYHLVDLLDGSNGEPRALCVLADGMGGHVGGAVASRTAVETFAHHFKETRGATTKERLQRALDAANNGIGARVGEDPSLEGMGCTLIGVWKKGEKLSFVSVGDSPMWRFRNGRLTRINADHSVKGELMKRVERGEMKIADVEAHPQKHQLRSALMGREIAFTDLRQEKLLPGDRIIMASDGVETLSEDEIRGLLRDNADLSPAEIATILVSEVRARNAPRQDNTSVIVLDHAPGKGAPPPSFLQKFWPPIAGAVALLVLLAALVYLWPEAGVPGDDDMMGEENRNAQQDDTQMDLQDGELKDEIVSPAEEDAPQPERESETFSPNTPGGQGEVDEGMTPQGDQAQPDEQNESGAPQDDVPLPGGAAPANEGEQPEEGDAAPQGAVPPIDTNGGAPN